MNTKIASNISIFQSKNQTDHLTLFDKEDGI